MKNIRILCAAGAVGIGTVASAQQPAAAGNPEAARAHISMCTGCHTIPGYQASFPRVYRVPKIGGQSAKYIESALQSYKKGERDHPTMQAIAKGLTDQQIADIAAYYAARGAEAAK
ncbi:MAG: cytochrome c [Burkholderiaceae bacterium]